MEHLRFLHPKSKILFPNQEAKARYGSLKLAHAPVEAEYPYRGEREFWFTFQTGETWRVHLDQTTPVEVDLFDKIHTESLPKKLKKRVVPGRLEEKQQETLYFLHANWEEVVNLFYTTEYEKRLKPVAFTQVSLDSDDRQCADFVGIGPDGKVFLIVAASDERNNSQELERQYDWLISKFDLRAADVVPLLANFVAEQKEMPEGHASNGRLNIFSRIYNGASLI